jgi:hypothetical protein
MVPAGTWPVTTDSTPVLENTCILRWHGVRA